DKIVFYLLNKDFPKEWFEHLNFNLYKKDSKIIDIKVNNDSLEKYYTYTGSVATFYRFFIPELIPKDKVLYLDSDLIVTSNLDELYQCSLDDNYVAAVPDLLTELLREDNGSFNAGVMLVNNKMWREHNITQKSLIYYKDNESHILDGDQTVLNALFKDKWKILSNKFNFLTGAELVFKSRCLTNMLARLNDFMGDPTVVHYNTQHKPWKDTGLECSFRELYWFYRNLDWDDIILSKK
ncbi:glycosyltransferase family 8 protein, partial [Ursidibacter sp. B-7004-1]